MSAYRGYAVSAHWLLRLTAGSACSPQTRTALPPSSADVQLAVSGTLNRMPSLAVSGNRVVAVWTSTQNDVMDVYAAVSEDGGSDVLEPRSASTIGRETCRRMRSSHRASASSESAITIIWPSRRDGTTDIRMARSTDGGRTFRRQRTLTCSGRLQGLRGWQGLTPGRNGGFLRCGSMAAMQRRDGVTSSSRRSRIARRRTGPRPVRRDRTCMPRSSGRMGRLSSLTSRAMYASAVRPRLGWDRAVA